MQLLIFNNIIYLLCNAFSVFTKYKAMYIFFDESKTNKKTEFLFFLGYFFINSGLYLIFKAPMINLTNNIIIFFILTFNYVSKFGKKIFVTFVVYTLSMIIESIIYYIFNFFIPDGDSEAIIITISCIIIYIIIFLLKNLEDIRDSCSFKYVLIISLISLSSIYISVVLMKDLKNQIIHIILSIALLLFINIFIIYLYDILNKRNREEFENKLLAQQNNFYIKQIELTNEAQDNLRFFKHDIVNHLLSLKSISNDSEKIDEYIDEYINLSGIADEYAKSGNIVIDSILNYKLQEAHRREIKFELELKIPVQLNIKPYDIGAILGNLLDNAIEAAAKNKSDKQIKINIFFEKNNLSINILNTFNGSVNIDGKKYRTTYKNKINHGFGLSSVKKTVEKYDGIIDISNTESLFTVKVLLYNNGK